MFLINSYAQFFMTRICFNKLFQISDNKIGDLNSRITKPSYKTELRIMTSQTELLILKFSFLLIFRDINLMRKKLQDNFRVSNSRFLKKIKFLSY